MRLSISSTIIGATAISFALLTRVGAQQLFSPVGVYRQGVSYGPIAFVGEYGAVRMTTSDGCWIASTTDGGRGWAEPVRVACGLDSSELAVSSTRWYWSSGSSLVYAPLKGGREHRIAIPFIERSSGEVWKVCSFAVFGPEIFAALGASCLSLSIEMVRSVDDGLRWNRVAGLPARWLGSSSSGAIVMDSANAGAVVGWATGRAGSHSFTSDPVVAITRDAGATWSSAKLPCRKGPNDRGWVEAIVAAHDRDLVALCEGPSEEDLTGTEVVSSDDGGRSWFNRCGNGVLVYRYGRCPLGQPISLVELDNGVTVIAANSNGPADLDASSNSGVDWHSIRLSDLPFAQVSGSAAIAWALAYGVNGGVLESSRNGLTWRRSSLPTRS